MLLIEQVSAMIPNNKEPELWHSFANEYLDLYEINTKGRIAGFFAQAAHESRDFNDLIENLNYSWERLMEVFPSYFPSVSFAKQYHRNPQMIANRVYNDNFRKNKLGNTQEGDGWRFRGRGIFQLTGRYNYSEFAKYIGKTPEETAIYCGTKRGAFESACWYWKNKNLNRFADKDDINGMSLAVNGGNIGLSDRISKYKRNKTIMASNITAPSLFERMLSRGSKGEDVRVVQKQLGLVADGVFGVNTEKAVRSWQRSNKRIVTGKLTVDEIKILLKI